MKKEQILKIMLGLSGLFTFVIPLSTKLSNVFLILFISFLLSFLYGIKKELKFKSTFWCNTTFLIYIISLIGLNWFDIGFGLVRLETRMSLFLFPLLFFCDESVLYSINHKAKIGFLFGSVFSSIILFCLQLYYYSTIKIDDLSDVFNYYTLHHQYSGRFHFHATYLSFFFLLAIHILLKDKVITNNYLKILLLIVLLINQIYLFSRLILIIQFVSIIVYIIVDKTIHNKIKLVFFSSVLTLIVIGVVLIKKTFFYERFKNITWELTKNTNESNLGDSRFSRWIVATEVIRDKPLLGYGTGNEKNALHIKFKEFDLLHSAESFYDSHNQFLSFIIENGLILFSLFLFLMIHYSYKTLKYGDSFQILFLIAVILLLNIETSLNVNVFVTFFAFFMNLNLAIISKKDEFH